MFTRAESLQMNLCERFAEASSSRSVNISNLGKPFSVTGAERVQTKYGISTPHDQSAFHRRCACIPSQTFHASFFGIYTEELISYNFCCNIVMVFMQGPAGYIISDWKHIPVRNRER